MTEELQLAIKTIAEYDEDVECWCRDGNYAGMCKPYHTSADALLPVLNKLKNTPSKADTTELFLDYAFQIYEVGESILRMDYPQACIKLAGIIKQLKPIT